MIQKRDRPILRRLATTVAPWFLLSSYGLLTLKNEAAGWFERFSW